MPPSRHDIAMDMLASPLYGQDALFTRMDDGISKPMRLSSITVFAQVKTEDLRRALPDSQVTKVLVELYEGDLAKELDSRDLHDK